MENNTIETKEETQFNIPNQEISSSTPELILPNEKETTKIEEKIEEDIPEIVNTIPDITEEIPLEKELPHQENDIKPEEITEIKQEPLQEYINPHLKEETVAHEAVKEATKELQKEQRKLDEVIAKRKKIEEEIEKLKETLNDYSSLRTNSQINVNSNLLMAKFLQKLSFLRKEANQKRLDQKNEKLKKIYEYLLENSTITNDKVEELTGVKHNQASKYLNILKKQGKITRHGKSRNTYYTLK